MSNPEWAEFQEYKQQKAKSADGVAVERGRDMPLPASSNKDFWVDDSFSETVNVNEIAAPKMSDHYLVWDGPHAKCVSCPFAHTIPLDFRKYDLVDGKPVLKLKNKGK